MIFRYKVNNYVTGKDMKLYLAPLEGITGYIYRNALEEFFPGADKYYAPFITPPIKRELATKEIRELCKEHNEKIKLVPQVLTVNSADFNLTKEVLRDYGYEEVNINLGCPSKTVTSKGRGAGALQNLDKLDEFLYGVYESGDEKISIKTRIGISDVEEFDRIMEIYKKYPVYELTIHPRLMNQAYKGKADRDVFFKAAADYHRPLCYNGDINTLKDYEELVDRISQENNAVMCGRGVLKNPSLLREIKGGKPATMDELEAFLERILEEYSEVFSGETPVLFKMKEIWSYLSLSFDNMEKESKKLLKAKSISEYRIYAKKILRG